MNKNIWLFAVLLAIVALAPVGLYFYNYWTRPGPETSYVTVQYSVPKAKSVAVGEELNVMACRIVDGHIFYLLLENNEWIEAHLTVATKDEATPPVTEALKTAGTPSVLLRRKFGNYWMVDFHLTVQGKRMTLLDWLRERELTL